MLEIGLMRGGFGRLLFFVSGVLITYDTLGVAEWMGWTRREISDDTRS